MIRFTLVYQLKCTISSCICRFCNEADSSENIGTNTVYIAHSSVNKSSKKSVSARNRSCRTAGILIAQLIKSWPRQDPGAWIQTQISQLKLLDITIGGLSVQWACGLSLPDNWRTRRVNKSQGSKYAGKSIFRCDLRLRFSLEQEEEDKTK